MTALIKLNQIGANRDIMSLRTYLVTVVSVLAFTIQRSVVNTHHIRSLHSNNLHFLKLCFHTKQCESYALYIAFIPFLHKYREVRTRPEFDIVQVSTITEAFSYLPLFENYTRPKYHVF